MNRMEDAASLAAWAGGWLSIDLDAIAANWRALQERTAPAECAAVVKADAYGLGIEHVAPALDRAGCRTFFVAHLAEGVALRRLLPPGRTVFVLNGIPPGTAPVFVTHDLLPVLNSIGQIAEWRAAAFEAGRPLAASVQIDTGMSRFGLPPHEVVELAGQAHGLAGIEIRLVMSHLGCADTPDHPANQEQLASFERLASLLPPAPRSLAASSGIFLGSRYHLDLVRPGVALYGVPPTARRPNPMRPVVRLQARVVQTRRVQPGDWVGYGAMFRATRPTDVATVAIGYADGFLRASSGGVASLPDGGPMLPIIGRISMDCLAIDVTGVPVDRVREGMPLDLIGPHRPIEDAADAAGTIGYELLTSLGNRYHRSWHAGR
ncbi:alanine racemase [Lichenicola cladoniae]|uniref:Alanine racemase n=1 Tax=Lichenicola cladoniae TaxID=1484109 RepID=A0A6M8H917_9PROT|nr:alanine racemase [Lichenicola cladoniae]NPD68520.1 alanine racemase [Acetobacteraceae bacterium]QKE88993.1 alanine racemase [Lichenicola cladoniae]